MLTDHRRYDAAKLFLVFTVPESCFFSRIGQESAFNQYAGTVYSFHQVYAFDWLALSVTARIQSFNQSCLKLLPQFFAPVRLCVKHLRPAVAGITELILMDTDKQGVVDFIYDSDPFL